MASGFTVTTTLTTVEFPFNVNVYVKLAIPANAAGATYVIVPFELMLAEPILGLETAVSVHSEHGSFERTFNVSGSPGDVTPASSTPPETLMRTVAEEVRPRETDDAT